jgi:hypothetical protein
MASNSRKTKTGLPMSFPASVYNDILDVTREFKRSRSLGGAAQRGAPATETRVLLKNGSGSAITNPFSVLEISARLGAAEDYRNKKTLQGVTPTSAARPVAILQAGAASGELVEAVVAGTTLARVNVVSTSDRYADAVSGDRDKLKSGAAGRFEIVEPLTSTGIQVVQVRFAGGTAATTGLPKVKNLSGYTVPEWGFLLIDGVDPLPSVDLPGFMSTPVFRGVAPLQYFDFSVYSAKRLVSVPSGAAPGETVDCIVDGRVPARIYSKYQRAPLMAHISRQEGILDVEGLEAFHEQTNFGFPILYRELGTGVKWGLIDLMPQNQPASIHAKAINGVSGGVPSGTLRPGQTYYYGGNPFSGNLAENGNTRILPSPTGIRFDGPSTWTGTISLTFRLVYNGLALLGSSGLYKVPGVRVQLNFTTGLDIGTYQRRWGEPVEFSLPPSVIAAADANELTGNASLYQVHNTLILPFTIQTEEGIIEKTGTEFKIEVYAWRSWGPDNATVTFAPTYATLIMHEIDPLLPRFVPGPGVTPAGGFLSSSATPDPLASLKTGISAGTGFLTSGGLRSVSPGFGSGFE